MPCPRPKTAVFFDSLNMDQDHDFFFLRLKFHGKFAIFCAKTFFLIFGERLKFRRTFFFLESTCALCPWSLASTIPVLGLERVCSRKVGPWPRNFFVSFASSLVSSTPPLTVISLVLKVNLHSIRFSYVFVRFFTFLLLLEKVCAFSSAFLFVYIRTNQTVTYWTKVFRKNFFVKG